MTDEKTAQGDERGAEPQATAQERIERLLRQAVADAQELDERLRRVFLAPGEPAPLRSK